MAFFGLTALGAQNSFAAALKGTSCLGVFTDSDWDVAFAKVSSTGKSLFVGLL
jgi:hypothetical protein